MKSALLFVYLLFSSVARAESVRIDGLFPGVSPACTGPACTDEKTMRLLKTLPDDEFRELGHIEGSGDCHQPVRIHTKSGEALRIDEDGSLYYRGKLLGPDPELRDLLEHIFFKRLCGKDSQ